MITGNRRTMTGVCTHHGPSGGKILLPNAPSLTTC